VDISKPDTEYLKGIAILLMFLHHLFASSDRILEPASYTPIFSWFRLEFFIGDFGKICIPMFAFLSGYGFAAIGKKQISYYAGKIFRFYRVYWFYFAAFIVFVPLGFILLSYIMPLGGHRFAFYFNIFEFLANFFAVSDSYNGEWWFAETYILIIVIIPLINMIRHNTPLILFLSVCLFFLSIGIFRLLNVDTPGVSVIRLMYWQSPFVFGYLACMNKKKLKIFFTQKKSITVLIFIVFATLSVLLCRYLALAGAILAAPLFILSSLLAKKSISYLDGLFRFLGRYSFPMWLTHSFFCYYYFQDFIYSPKNPVLIFMNLTVVTLLTVYILEIVRIKIGTAVFRKLSLP